MKEIATLYATLLACLILADTFSSIDYYRRELSDIRNRPMESTIRYTILTVLAYLAITNIDGMSKSMTILLFYTSYHLFFMLLFNRKRGEAPYQIGRTQSWSLILWASGKMNISNQMAGYFFLLSNILLFIALNVYAVWQLIL